MTRFLYAVFLVSVMAGPAFAGHGGGYHGGGSLAIALMAAVAVLGWWVLRQAGKDPDWVRIAGKTVGWVLVVGGLLGFLCASFKQARRSYYKRGGYECPYAKAQKGKHYKGHKGHKGHHRSVEEGEKK